MSLYNCLNIECTTLRVTDPEIQRSVNVDSPIIINVHTCREILIMGKSMYVCEDGVCGISLYLPYNFVVN